MSCVLNINRFLIPNDVIVDLSDIYQYIGENNEIKNIVGNDLNTIIDQTVEKDAFYLSKIIGLDISDARSRLILNKNSNPRNKEENTLYNLKDILSSFQRESDRLPLQTNEFLNEINYVFNHYAKIKYDFVSTKKRSLLQGEGDRSKRLLLDEIILEMNTILKTRKFERIILYLHFFIDFYNIKPFYSTSYTNVNEVASLLLLYNLMIKSDLECFHYVSFFELVSEELHEFREELSSIAFNWDEGYAQTLGFVRFIMNIILTAYEKNYKLMKDYKFDKNFKKQENIENTIMGMTREFSKEDIRAIHPYVSESTINRSLISLRDRGFIAPTGKGRSAKWTKVERKQRKHNNYDK